MIKPTVVYKLFGGKIEVRIYGKSPCDLEEKHVFQIASDLGIRNVYHPDTSNSNAKICRPRDFTKVKVDGIEIYSGCLTDGVSLVGQENAVWLQTADCPTIIAYHHLTDEVIVAHAGRASLIDEKGLRTGKASRQPESVARVIYEHLIDYFRQTSVNIEIHSCCGIGPIQFRHPTNHPQYGSFNETMNRYIALFYGVDCFLGGDINCGALDLHRLIHNQFRLCGIPADNIRKDVIDTANQRELFFSRRGGDPTGHNTILVIRRA